MEKILTQLGFSPKESRVYLACLELGPSEVSMLARHGNINRTNCYQILELLVSKKIVKIAQQKPKKIYQAEEPNKLQELLEDDIKEKQNQLEKLKQSMPRLKSLHNTLVNKPQVRFFEGIEGLKEMYAISLSSMETLRAYTSAYQLEETLGKQYTNNYFNSRAKRKISIKAILPFEPHAVELKKKEKQYLRSIRFVPIKTYNFSPEIYIYDNKIAFMSLKEHFGVLVESRELADAMKKAFDLSWGQAFVYHKKIMKELA